MRTVKLFDALAIRDNTAHPSTLAGAEHPGTRLLAFENTLNQIVSVQVQGSFKGKTPVWHNIGSAISVAALSGQTPGTGDVTITSPWPYIQAVATAASAPASGSFSGYLSEYSN